MLVAVVLGNRLNDDGSLSDKMKARLNCAMQVIAERKPDKVILSGGEANRAAKKTEAQAMKEYLIGYDVDENLLVCESWSLTTKLNAHFSVPLAVKLGATELLLITSLEHMSRSYLNPIKLFQSELQKYPQIKLYALACPV